MSEFHDDYPQYELMAHHSEEDGKKKRRKLWNVFWIMLAVTVLELIIGFKASSMGLLNDDRTSSVALKIIFIGLTIGKAYFIVFSFMHLGDERKPMKWSILAPYMVFILYFVWICVQEANYCRIHKDSMDNIIVQQKIHLNEAAKNGHHEEHGAATEGTHEEGAHEDATKPAE
ncbi:hypothetical protein BH10BAC1_BH10BAC1_04600 [soil metagenome]